MFLCKYVEVNVQYKEIIVCIYWVVSKKYIKFSHYIHIFTEAYFSIHVKPRILKPKDFQTRLVVSSNYVV